MSEPRSAPNPGSITHRSLRGGLPRAFDVVAAASGLLAGLPLLLAIALMIRISSPGPILFRQTRVGRNGRPFEMLKFRTMRDQATREAAGGEPEDPAGDQRHGSTVTVGGDARVTRVGALLRRTKLDELPELVNVLRGEMALVGPRPEVPEYVALSDPAWQRVLQTRPGLTSETSLLLRAEEEVLRLGIERTGSDTDSFYRERLLPFKLSHAADAESRRTTWRDLCTLVATGAALFRAPVPPEVLLQRILEAPQVREQETGPSE